MKIVPNITTMAHADIAALPVGAIVSDGRDVWQVAHQDVVDKQRRVMLWHTHDSGKRCAFSIALFP